MLFVGKKNEKMLCNIDKTVNLKLTLTEEGTETHFKCVLPTVCPIQ